MKKKKAKLFASLSEKYQLLSKAREMIPFSFSFYNSTSEPYPLSISPFLPSTRLHYLLKLFKSNLTGNLYSDILILSSQTSERALLLFLNTVHYSQNTPTISAFHSYKPKASPIATLPNNKFPTAFSRSLKFTEESPFFSCCGNPYSVWNKMNLIYDSKGKKLNGKRANQKPNSPKWQ